ncbi:phosphoglycerol transferase MdoB-like AlkP superfamily enzyme [Paenibacillus amylolyticus]|uniref:Phosphoglycerol transferase MdoB-like AlkP superfamily enzyme n=1 Tax=Paenibacillus amylolyticus TaxID=1451 RepID=A0AAP5H3E5_PAEAM|nr:hypothetical protein [Paenibacillus amylolyticus]MDR6725588.1 phosphoglycerol transferase MdoB-like AlkP superfamily enzyme [Paenibacillus amylolyticus]
METFTIIWIVFIIAILLYRMIFQKFKEHNRENIGLSGILIVFTWSNYTILQMNEILFFAIIAVAVYCAVWNSILLVRKINEPERLS